MADFLFIKNKRFLGLVFIYYRVHEISNAENCSKINKRSSFIRDLRVCDSALSFLVRKALQLSPPFHRECPIRTVGIL